MSFRVCFAGAAALALALASSGAAFSQAVVVRAAGEGMTARFKLDGPVADFRFEDGGVVRSDWVMRTPGLSLDADKVQATQGVFENFEISLTPDTTEEGRGYIAVTRVGAGYVIFAPALTSAGQTLRLSTEAPADWTLWPRDDVSGYVYLGPSSAMTATPPGGMAIIAPAISPEVKTVALGGFDKALAFFTSSFGPAPKTPTLVLTPQGAGPMTFRADVTDTGVISARLSGSSWDAPSEEALANLDLLAFHETVHLWNSHFARPAEGSPWLHEGGAQYLALAAAVSTGRLSQAGARDALGASLTGCRRAVGEIQNAAERMSGGNAVYDCGVLIQWLADMELRQTPGRESGVISVWRAFIDHARDGRPDYGPSDFLAALPPQSGVSTLLEGPANERWATIEQSLSALGVRWENRPSSETYLTAALFHLNNNNCQPSSEKGFYFREGYVEMANAATCGVLSGKVELGTIEGLDPMTDAQAMFEAVQQRCAAGEAIRIRPRGGGPAFEALCVTPLKTPIGYEVTAAPTLVID